MLTADFSRGFLCFVLHEVTIKGPLSLAFVFALILIVSFCYLQTASEAAADEQIQRLMPANQELKMHRESLVA